MHVCCHDESYSVMLICHSLDTTVQIAAHADGKVLAMLTALFLSNSSKICVLSLITTHCVTEPGPNYRRSVGGESPELAESLLQTGQYVPRSAQDMWSFGMAMLEVLGGQRPLEHQLLLMSAQFKAEVQATGRSKAHLEYLARLLLDSVPYADQVLLPETLIKAATSNGFDHHTLLECCQ